MNRPDIYDANTDEDEEDVALADDQGIHWSNIMFLPFHPTFKFFVLISVIIKSLLGPIQAVYPIVYCWDVMEHSILHIIKYLYLYFCDPIYIADTFLHMVHRQVTDEAMKREHLPKSSILLVIDIISITPFIHLLSREYCPPIQIWPNIVTFTEFIIIYRIADYFSMVTTHSYWKLIIGYTLIVFISINCVTCFLLLLTSTGLCRNCTNGNYDWRKYVLHKFNETDARYATYIYGASIVVSYVIHQQFDETKASTYLEFVYLTIFMMVGYFIILLVIFPKLFAEAHLNLKRICTYHPVVERIIQETKRRNPSPKAYLDVKNFYTLMWKKRGGITSIPEVISELPKYLRIDIRQDLVWPIFYHSPTFRRTSIVFKRWICEHVRLDYKLPGEKFFAGPHCLTQLYYLKTGIVQLISADDGITPLISVTSGTVFGDISFFLPPMKRKERVRCLTYCEVLYITRLDILIALHMFPDDRRLVMENVKSRIKHARTLYTCKQHVRGLDRSEDEGIDWVKRRWWEISRAVSEWKRRPVKKNKMKCELPPEEAVYHCAKYIGQLVLCTEAQLQITSMFTNVKFPWIFAQHSSFVVIWRRIVVTTVYFAVILYPPCLTFLKVPVWFSFVQFWTDLIYAADILVSLLTSTMRQENTIDNFASVMFTQCKRTKFVLDLLSTVWIEKIVVLVGFPEMYYACQFNRLIKIYVICPKWDISKDPFIDVCYKNCLIQLSFMYIISYLLYLIDWHLHDFTTSYFFGELLCKIEDSKEICHADKHLFFNVTLAWILEFLFNEYLPNTLLDMYVVFFVSYAWSLVHVYCQTSTVAGFYLKYRETANFQYFVSNMKKHYQHYNIHPALLTRLNRYLICHWKYYKGMDVMHPELLKNEPYDIWFKVHGEVAENIIKQSSAFLYANPLLIKELAYKAKFLILPKNSTLFLFGIQCKTVIWSVQGHIKCEYHDEKGELLRIFFGPGELLSTPSVFIGHPALRTLVTYTECEILYIKIQDFYGILKHYPAEMAYFDNCIKKFGTVYKNMYQEYANKHKTYQTRLRDKVLNAAKSKTRLESAVSPLTATILTWMQPDSPLTGTWMLIRAITVVVSITSAALQGGSGAPYRHILIVISHSCTTIALLDMLFKMFFGYYDKRGLLITSKLKCLLHYLSHGFILDLIGVVPVRTLIKLELTKDIDDNTALFMNTLAKFSHLYLLTGYLDYVADTPIANMAFVMILKWHIVTSLTMLGAAHFLVNNCIKFHWDSWHRLTHMTSYNNCWLPNYLDLDERPTVDQLHMVFAQSLNLAQNGLMRTNLGKFNIDRQDLGVVVILFILSTTSFFVMCYSLTLLVLNFRGNTIFQHGVSQLRHFLTAERVEKKVMDRAIKHFGYWWLRTKGINMQNLMNERIGIVFRQDLSHYLFSNTFAALNTILNGGETIQRYLCGAVTELFFLPGEEIIREMDLSPWVYIVHRGRILIQKDGQKIAVLTKGCVFGQLTGTKPRPVRISAKAEEHADILQIPFQSFREAAGAEKVRTAIEDNPQSKDDYMATEEIITEDPYNTVKYILRGVKAIKLRGHNDSIIAKNGTWYFHWLFIAWFLSPTLSTALTLFLYTVPMEFEQNVYWFLLLSDVVHFVYFMSEFFTIELVVEDGKCLERRLKWRYFKKWTCYADILSLLLPMFIFGNGNDNWGLARLIRLHLFYQFHRHFCTGFKSIAAPILLKIAIAFLMVHAMTCGWMYVACREDIFPVEVIPLPEHIEKTVDYSEWQHPDDRRGGCARITRNFYENGSTYYSFLVPKDWTADYIVAMSYILIIYTTSEVDSVVPVTLKQVYCKVVITIIIYIMSIWILSVAISAIYTKLRNLYRYDCSVIELLTYLDHNGLSPVLLKSVREYTKQLWQRQKGLDVTNYIFYELCPQLWQRQKGNWLPELAQQAPQCLREDILSALYIHHLEAPPVFKDLPAYFIRQLVTRLHRVVVFPGKFILQEGDIYSAMYFIHEGEVEKWQTDKGGDKRLLSILTANGYFGLIPGLFPNTPFQYSYYSRTVVDLVVLRYRDWQDLLHGYPQIKHDLYAAAKQFK